MRTSKLAVCYRKLLSVNKSRTRVEFELWIRTSDLKLKGR